MYKIDTALGFKISGYRAGLEDSNIDRALNTGDLRKLFSTRGLTWVSRSELNIVSSEAHNISIKNLATTLLYFKERMDSLEKIKEDKAFQHNEEVERLNKEIRALKKETKETLNPEFTVIRSLNNKHSERMFYYFPGTLVKFRKEKECNTRRGLIRSSLINSKSIIPELVYLIEDQRVDLKEVIENVNNLKIEDEYFIYEKRSNNYLVDGLQLKIAFKNSKEDFVNEIIIDDFSRYKCFVEKIELNENSISNFKEYNYGTKKVIILKEGVYFKDAVIHLRQMKPESKGFSVFQEDNQTLMGIKNYRLGIDYPYERDESYLYKINIKNITFLKNTHHKISGLNLIEEITLKEKRFKVNLKEVFPADEIRIYGKIKYIDGTKIVKEVIKEFAAGEIVEAITSSVLYTDRKLEIFIVFTQSNAYYKDSFLYEEIEVEHVKGS